MALLSTRHRHYMYRQCCCPACAAAAAAAAPALLLLCRHTVNRKQTFFRPIYVDYPALILARHEIYFFFIVMEATLLFFFFFFAKAMRLFLCCWGTSAATETSFEKSGHHKLFSLRKAVI